LAAITKTRPSSSTAKPSGAVVRRSVRAPVVVSSRTGKGRLADDVVVGAELVDDALVMGSIARTMAVLGEPWTALILRDLFIGITRFQALHAHLGVSRKVLSLRLNRLARDEIGRP
jgi:HxlR-like helix-turn-helix